MEFLEDTWFFFMRLVRGTIRMPVYLVISIVQPVLWLSLFGQLFRSSSANYVQFLAPGIAVMTALFGAAYSGMGMLGDIDRGVLDRLLATPVTRGAVMAGRILHSAVQVLIQSALIVLAGALLGARPQGGVAGIAAVLLSAGLLGAAFAAFSNALALLARRQELLIAVMNFVVLPMTFLSTMLRSAAQIPGWIAGLARLNPVNWAVVAARSGFEGHLAESAWSLAFLVLFVLACGWLATLSFSRYRQTL